MRLAYCFHRLKKIKSQQTLFCICIPFTVFLQHIVFICFLGLKPFKWYVGKIVLKRWYLSFFQKGESLFWNFLHSYYRALLYEAPNQTKEKGKLREETVKSLSRCNSVSLARWRVIQSVSPFPHASFCRLLSSLAPHQITLIGGQIYIHKKVSKYYF